MPCEAEWFLVRTALSDMMNSNLDLQDSIHRTKALTDRGSRFAWKPRLSSLSPSGLEKAFRATTRIGPSGFSKEVVAPTAILLKVRFSALKQQPNPRRVCNLAPVHSRPVDGSEAALCACSGSESSNARVVESLMVPISFN